MGPEALADLHRRAFRVPRPWTGAEFATLLIAPGVFLVTAGGGFALGRHAADEAELLTLAVAPDSRRAGTGRGLLAAFEAGARRRDATRAFLEVAADNVAARALYRRAGWRTAGIRPGYFRDNGGPATDALILAKCLSEAQSPAAAPSPARPPATTPESG